MEGGWLVIYYSTAFPKYAAQRRALEARDPVLAGSFMRRYEIWLAVHSLLHYQDQQTTAAAHQEAEVPFGSRQREMDPEVSEIREREERCRIAVMSSLFAAREVQIEAPQGQADAE